MRREPSSQWAIALGQITVIYLSDWLPVYLLWRSICFLVQEATTRGCGPVSQPYMPGRGALSVTNRATVECVRARSYLSLYQLMAQTCLECRIREISRAAPRLSGYLDTVEHHDVHRGVGRDIGPAQDDS